MKTLGRQTLTEEEIYVNKEEGNDNREKGANGDEDYVKDKEVATTGRGAYREEDANVEEYPANGEEVKRRTLPTGRRMPT